MKKILLMLSMVVASLGSYGQSTFPASKTTEYAATVLNTSFTVPIIRFNRIANDPTKQGDVSAFNSIGAGVGLSLGRLSVTADDQGKDIATTMHNTFGIQAGFLFAANTNEDATNTFALTGGISLLNFQLGYGYEFGTVRENQKRGFFTIAYSIPLSTFVKGGFYVLRRSKAVTDSSFYPNN
jgi:hypothetical protein